MKFHRAFAGFAAFIFLGNGVAKSPDIFETQKISEPLLEALPAGGVEESLAPNILNTTELEDIVQEPFPEEEFPRQKLTFLDKQKQLFYLLARLKRSGPARPLGAIILQKAPRDKETLLVLCSLELERKNPAGVIHYARRFLKFYPTDHQGWYFIAAAESQMRHFARAQGILEGMKAKYFSKKAFPYQVDLASTARLSGDWRTALAIYKKLLEDQQIAPKLRDEARGIIDQIYREQLSRIAISTVFQDLTGTGQILRSEARWESPLTNRIRLEVAFQQDNLHQLANGVARDFRVIQHQATVAFETHIEQSWYLKTEVGGSNEGLLAAAELRRKLAPGKAWFFGAGYNIQATDSLALELLDGRQSKAYFGADWTLDDASNWRVAALAFGRVVTVEQQMLGNGGGAEWQLERILMTDPVSIRMAYVGQFAKFNTTATNPSMVQSLFTQGSTPVQQENALANEGVVAGSPETLINPSINYHGLTFSAKRAILPSWTVETVGVLGYYFDTSQASYGGFLRNTWRPKKSIEAQFNVGYLSSGVQSNVGSQVLEISLALQVLF